MMSVCGRNFRSDLVRAVNSFLRIMDIRRRAPSGWVNTALFMAAISLSLSISPAQSNPVPEVTAPQIEQTFKLKAERNLVVVRVIIQDSGGNMIGDLRSEDFEILDNGKPQTILDFSVESKAPKPLKPQSPEMPADTGTQPGPGPAPKTSSRYLALYFDDIHMSSDDIIRSRDTAVQFLDSALAEGDRAGIFTSSGQRQLDFTDDRAKLRAALALLRTRPVAGPSTDPCSDMSDYEAYMVAELHDRFALAIATEEFLQCRYGQRGGGDAGGRGGGGAASHFLDMARRDAEIEARKVLRSSEFESKHVLRGVDRLVRRMASLPGQRSIVLVSSGFFAEGLMFDLQEVIDRALRLNVVVSGLDSRGLYVVIAGDREGGKHLPVEYSAVQRAQKEEFEFARQRLATQTMQSLAESTGGIFYNNNNDLLRGLRKIAGLAGTYYVLTFSPKNLKVDGSFHSLKVRIASRKGLTIQARRGYFAPKKTSNSGAQAEVEIRQASLSEEEWNDLPLELQTRLVQSSKQSAQLSVVAHVDARQLTFGKDKGLSVNGLTFVAVLFDRNGKYITGQRKLVNLRLSDATLQGVLRSGIQVEALFDVAPGSYLVREVVREAQGGQMSALSRKVEIPE